MVWSIRSDSRRLFAAEIGEFIKGKNEEDSGNHLGNNWNFMGFRYNRKVLLHVVSEISGIKMDCETVDSELLHNFCLLVQWVK